MSDDTGYTKESFNTSHVVVYLMGNNQLMRNPMSFNTSHVVVYHNLSFQDRLKI